MKLGIGSYTYPWAIGLTGQYPEHPMTAGDLLAKAVQLGVRVVQICDNLPLERMSEPELARLERLAREADMQIEVGTRGIALAHLRQCLRLAERFHSPILRVVVDQGGHEPSPAEVVVTVKELLPELSAGRVCLAIENHDRFSSRTFAEIFDSIGSDYVGLCLDTVNSFGALEGPEAVVERLAQYAVNLHVKDFVIRRAPTRLGFTVEGAPAGQGRLNLPWLLDCLRAQGRVQSAILEQWTPFGESVGATIAREDAWAAASVTCLRKLIPE